MRITVFGATGGIGGHVVSQALDAGDQVTAVVRDTAAFDRAHPALEVVRVAGLTDPDPLRTALVGSDAAISGVGPRSRRDGPVASTATAGILRALDGTGVGRFVAVSAAPVGPVPPGDSFLNGRVLFPLIGALLKDTYADLAAMEEQIARGGTDWTVLRPPRLTNKPPTGAYRTVIGGNVPRGTTISRADAAHAMLAALTDPAQSRRAVGVAY